MSHDHYLAGWAAAEAGKPRWAIHLASEADRASWLNGYDTATGIGRIGRGA